MSEDSKASRQSLLYDPLFRNKPDTKLHDNPSGGIFGKIKFKKAVIIFALAASIGVSMFFSFSSVSSDKYLYKKNGEGWLFYEYSGAKDDKVLSIDYVTDKCGNQDISKPVTEVRRFALSCNPYLEYIYVGDSVEKIDGASFYFCTALKAVIVSPENKNYASVAGVLYRKKNGVLTEIVLYPMNNAYFRAALELGCRVPLRKNDLSSFVAETRKNDGKITESGKTTGESYEIAESVTKIGELCFNTCTTLEDIVIPDGVKTIETMAFFKCEKLKDLYLPDGLESIGSDAFSGCKAVDDIFIPASVEEIGHHAFYNCTAARCVRMEHKDKEGIILGQQWEPRTRNVFMRAVDVLYNQKRGGDKS